MERSHITRPMWLLWFLSAALIGLDGFDFFIIGVALPFIKLDFSMDATQTGAIAVAAILGSLVGSLTLGPVTDRVGRQLMLAIDVVIFVVASTATALAWNVTSLIVFRFLVGIGIGADYPISVAYITENVPSRFRGRMVIGAFTFQSLGALLGAVTGLAVIRFFQVTYPDALLASTHYAWRWMLGVGSILAVAVAILRFQFLLESPLYYIARGEYEQASQAASELLEHPVNISAENEPLPRDSKLNYAALFSPEFAKRTILAAVPWFLQDIATYGVGIFTPVIIAMLAFADETDFVMREFRSAQGAAFVEVFLVVGFILAILLVERVGRIPLQVTGFIGMAVGLSLLAFDSHNSSDMQLTSANLMMILAGFVIFNLFMNMGPNATTFLLSGEVFPTAIRASGAGLAAGIAKSGAVLGTFGLPILRQSYGEQVLLFGVAGACLLGAGITYLFRVDTSGQPLT
ncbi:MAG: MFS transporter [Cyanobacteria bacterium P01_E01_bin.34]